MGFPNHFKSFLGICPFAESPFAESHFAESMGHLADFFGKVGIEIRQSGQGSCLHLQKQTFKAMK